MSDTPPRNDAAMAEILASIRRIVADEDRRGVASAKMGQSRLPPTGADVLELTPDMRIDDAKPRETSATPVAPAANKAPEAAAAPDAEPIELSVDEAVVVDIVRAVLRDEFEGAFGAELTRKLRKLASDEVSRALAERGARD